MRSIRIGDDQHEGAIEVPRENGRIILAHGEVTGHAHAIVSPEATLYQSSDASAQALGTRILAALVPVALTHEEHGRSISPRESGV